MPNHLRHLFFVGLLLIGITPVSAKPSFPDRGTQAVVDAANKFTPEGRKALNYKLVMWERKTKHQLVIATIPDLQGYPISDYGYQLGRAWKLGRTGVDDTAILFWAANTKHGVIRLEVGKGLEVVLTDAMSKQFTNETAKLVKPQGVEKALTQGADSIMAYIDAHEDDVRKPVKPIVGSAWATVLIWLALMLALPCALAFLFLRRSRPKQKQAETENTASRFKYSDKAEYPPFNPNPIPYRDYGSYRRYSSPPPSPPPVSTSSLAEVAAGTALGASLSNSSDDDDDDSTRRQASSDPEPDIGFTSDNSDSDNFAGGGSDSDCDS